ncbi:MAG: DUF4867 family protein [Cetobacterium sp.]|uniref:DUF4867 family protein n=1 Tax=Cetobacterium sp. TaxID=2071632 RepID=UPI003F31F59F
MLNKLNELNNLEILSCSSKEFERYGKVITGYDFNELVQYAEKNTLIPSSGNIYVGSVKEMEGFAPLFSSLENNFYGGMETQIGYCNGNNSFLNGLEYHKSSEINVAVTDLVLLLSKTTEIKNSELDSSTVKAFFLPRGMAIELYSTTMHFAPCKVTNDGFKCIVILPKETNTDISLEDKDVLTEEDKFLFKRNKWLLVHGDKQDLIAKGAFHGISGENLEIKF